MRLKGKTSIITGAGSGFGAGIARKFVAEGATVMIADLNFEAAENVANELGGLAHEVDVSRNASVAEMAQSALDRFG